jgi:TonB-linked SusC/RagA family outer membrane protein
MKKKCVNSYFSQRSAGNLLKKMKLLIAFFFTGLLGVSASTYSQQTKLSLKFDEVTVKEAFKIIEKNSEFVFFYNEDYIDVYHKVNIDVVDEKIEIILNEILKGTKNTFKIYDRQIVILPPERKVSSTTVKSGTDAEQKNVLSGSVKDTKGLSLPGVTVRIKGTTIGTITDNDGQFKLSVPFDAKAIIFSFVGMKTQEITIGTRTSFSIILEEETVKMDDVVVIGYGSAKKGDLTGSVTSIKASEISDTKSTSFVNSLQGKMAGIRIVSSSGEPGAMSNVSIRGSNTVYASSSPLYVIDGIQMDMNTNEVASTTLGYSPKLDPLSSINPADIISIDVLKDASATAIYGSRGANGVIIVTTKSGEAGTAKLTYDAYLSMSSVSKRMPVLSPDEWIDYRSVMDPLSFLFYKDSNGDGAISATDTPIDPYAYVYHNWQKEAFKTSFSQSHNISLDGGSKETRYSAGIGYLNDKSIVRSNGTDRYSARVKIDHTHRNLKIGLNINMSYSNFFGASNSGGAYGNSGIVQSLIYMRPVEMYVPNWDQEPRYTSILDDIDKIRKTTSLLRNTLSAYATYNFGAGFTLNTTAGGMLSSSKGEEYYSKEIVYGYAEGGIGTLQEIKSNNYFNTTQLSYKKAFGKSFWDAMIAAEINHYGYNSFLVRNAKFADETLGINDISKGSNIKTVASSRSASARLSYFGRINYNYLGKYLFTASLRADGSSKFGPGNKYGYFPSGAFAWKVSDESFMKAIKQINNLKLRLSYGVTGNERIPDYQYMSRMENSYYQGVLGLSPSAIENNNLKWETTAQYNAGVDFGLFKNRVQISGDYYKKTTTNMLLPTYFPMQSGFFRQWQNIGRVDNEGYEIQISTINMKNKGFSWKTDFNISGNRNKVMDLGNVNYINISIGGGFIASNVGRVMVGQPIGCAYGYKFIGVYQIDDFTWQNNSDATIPVSSRTFVLKPEIPKLSGSSPKPGWLKFANLDNSSDKLINEKDMTIISHSDPKFFGGLTNTLNFKGFELSAFLSFSYGNEIFNETQFRLQGGASASYGNISKDFWYNRWTPDNPTNNYGGFSENPISKPQIGYSNGGGTNVSTYYVEDASYIRLNSASLAYNIPVSIFKLTGLKNISNVKVYIDGNNLYTLTKYRGFDPETFSGEPLLSGFDRGSYPRARTLIFGVNVTF